MLLFHGWHKVHGGIGFILGMLAEHGIPQFIGYGIYLGEVVAPILIILGLFCRLSALSVVVFFLGSGKYSVSSNPAWR